MKTLLLALLIIPLAYAQQLQPVSSVQADCGKFLQPAITTAGTFNSATVDNRFAACDGWVVTYSSFGFATVSVLLQSAPLTTAGAAGTFVSFAGTIVTGSVNPTTATNQGEIRATGYFPYVRVQITTTGAGYLTAEFHGFKTNPNSGSGAPAGTGCPNPCPVIGPTASGSPPTTPPVLVAGLDTNAGNIEPLLVDFFGGLILGARTTQPPDLGTTTSMPFLQSSNMLGGMGIYSLPIITTADGNHFSQAPGDETHGPLVQLSGNSAVRSAQQAVTNAAVALTSGAAKNICVKGLSTNTASVYIGPTGITTSTGMELAPGDAYCGPVSNTNLIFVIATAGGQSISWIATN
jgi:hypothetical protein